MQGQTATGGFRLAIAVTVGNAQGRSNAFGFLAQSDDGGYLEGRLLRED